MPRLRELSIEAYARAVLPRTHELWSNGRTLERYRDDIAALARTPYGRKAYRTFAFGERGSIVASFKRYERDAVLDGRPLRVFGIGAVFTPPESRGRGYASAMLGAALDAGRTEGFDAAYLFSDIHPSFYAALGFVELPSRSISLRADSLDASRISAVPVNARAWSRVRALFDETSRGSSAHLERSATYWNWLRMRIAQGSEHGAGQVVNLLAESARGAAYVLGMREPQHDAFVVDEIGYSAGADALVAPLLRAAAGDLRRITGWLPPAPVRTLLPRGSVRRRSDGIFMAASLTDAGTAFVEALRTTGSADPLWSTDHI